MLFTGYVFVKFHARGFLFTEIELTQILCHDGLVGTLFLLSFKTETLWFWLYSFPQAYKSTHYNKSGAQQYCQPAVTHCAVDHHLHKQSDCSSHSILCARLLFKRALIIAGHLFSAIEEKPARVDMSFSELFLRCCMEYLLWCSCAPISIWWTMLDIQGLFVLYS